MALAIPFLAAAPTPAFAPPLSEKLDKLKKQEEQKRKEQDDRWETSTRRSREDLETQATDRTVFDEPGSPTPIGPPAAAAASVAQSRGATTVKLENYGARTQAGEPDQNGRMTKTIWVSLTPPKPGRVVVHTFGTLIDTALAAYRANAVADLNLTAFNDDKPVAGSSGKQSLIQYDAKAGALGRLLQIGSPSGEEDDIFVSTSFFPPEGGLSAFLASVNGSPFFNGVFTCVAPSGFCTTPDTRPVFILHNSMDKPLTITASSDLGAGVKAPKPFTLGPGAARTATFEFTTGFDVSSVRTVAGSFTFTGRAGGKVAAVVDHPALIVVKDPFDGIAPPKVRVDAQVRAGRVGETKVFDVDVTNDAAKALTGCHARGELYQHADVSWLRTDANDAAAGKPNEPFSIKPGKTAHMRVGVARRSVYVAEPRFDDVIHVDCANAVEPELDQDNHFGVTARVSLTPAHVVARTLSPKDGVLKVGSGPAEFHVVAKNLGPTAKLTARPEYVAPFEDGADRQFAATVCRADAGGECLGPKAAALTFKAEQDALSHFKVFVRAPDGPVTFDPTERRMFLLFEQPIGDGYRGDMAVGAESVAVRKK